MNGRSGSSPLDLDLLWSPAIVGIDNDSFVALFVTRSPGSSRQLRMEVAFTVNHFYRLSLISLLLLSFRMKNHQLPNLRLNSPVFLP